MVLHDDTEVLKDQGNPGVRNVGGQLTVNRVVQECASWAYPPHPGFVFALKSTMEEEIIVEHEVM